MTGFARMEGALGDWTWAVEADVVEALPAASVAVTSTASVLPTSSVVTV